MEHTTVKLDDKTNLSKAKERGGILGRLFGRGIHETLTSDAYSGSGTKTELDLPDIQGFILRGYRMPMVRHFLLSVRPAAQLEVGAGGTQAARAFCERR